MTGFTPTEEAAILDLRFPTTGASDFIAYSTNGSSEFAGWPASRLAPPVGPPPRAGRRA